MVRTDNHEFQYKQIPTVTDKNSITFVTTRCYSVQNSRIGEMMQYLTFSLRERRCGTRTDREQS